MNVSRLLSITLGFFLLTLIVLTAIFAEMPYKTADIKFIGLSELESKRTPSPNFSVDNVEWDMEYYKTTPDLADYRKFFDENCRNTVGIAAADCVAKVLQKKVPFGDLGKDAFSSDYNSQKALRDHLSGAPGHCVNYSAITSTALLSKGIPAMFVQVISPIKGGHNAVSVWDEDYGWVYFDPLNSIIVKQNDRPISAAAALVADKPLQTVVFNKSNNADQYVLKDFYARRLPFDGAVVYPEPWYYTRTGKRYGGLIYRGRMVGVGYQPFNFGAEQKILTVGIITNIVLLILSFSIFIFHLRKSPPKIRRRKLLGVSLPMPRQVEQI